MDHGESIFSEKFELPKKEARNDVLPPECRADRHWPHRVNVARRSFFLRSGSEVNQGPTARDGWKSSSSATQLTLRVDRHKISDRSLKASDEAR